MSDGPKRLVVGISGASGVIYGVRALEMLAEAGIETHVVVSKAAEMTLAYETEFKLKDLRERAAQLHPIGDVGASIASGSFRTLGMLILPCSIRTMSEIGTGVTSTLLTRAADVVLKERRRLVLGLRETPLHLGHLRTATSITEMGAVVAPLVPAFYSAPSSLDEMVEQSVGRLLDLFDIDVPAVRRWRDGSGDGA